MGCPHWSEDWFRTQSSTTPTHPLAAASLPRQHGRAAGDEPTGGCGSKQSHAAIHDGLLLHARRPCRQHSVRAGAGNKKGKARSPLIKSPVLLVASTTAFLARAAMAHLPSTTLNSCQVRLVLGPSRTLLRPRRVHQGQVGAQIGTVQAMQLVHQLLVGVCGCVPCTQSRLPSQCVSVHRHPPRWAGQSRPPSFPSLRTSI